jgi:GNAT superfamily N-acetyltransferase
MDIKYRNAQKKDCSKVAEYINYASDGVLDFLFEDTVGGMTVAQILTYGLEDENGHNSYKSVIVAEYNLDIIGIIQSYSSKYHRIDDEMRSFFPKEKLEQFKEFYESRIDNSLLINAMFVNKDFRCKGIGTRFISLAKTKAESLGFDKLSLFVLTDNLNAQKVYHSNGFKIVKEIKLKDTVKINHKGEMYLTQLSH